MGKYPNLIFQPPTGAKSAKQFFTEIEKVTCFKTKYQLYVEIVKILNTIAAKLFISLLPYT